MRRNHAHPHGGWIETDPSYHWNEPSFLGQGSLHTISGESFGRERADAVRQVAEEITGTSFQKRGTGFGFIKE